MSFITKRERVFNEYDIYDLPSRNEGKLKAYASCTDARAWSHFCSDKSEHLTEIIKRNNETCRPKYVPTHVIVDTIMISKNAEISRLNKKIEEFEQMIAAYDDLELTCEQKCEISNAHAAIKAANKELDELCVDLDLSGFTEGVDSEAFETGKSRGDEAAIIYGNDETEASPGVDNKGRRKEEEVIPTDTPKLTREKPRGTASYIVMKQDGSVGGDQAHRPEKENKSNQTGLSCPCDVSVSAHDPRIQEMEDTIISKDAKLSAMQNTIAVLENDVCEPYCIYANIYTAIEKIFGILCQNDKYKSYLNLLTAGKDTRCIDIKGKILYKMKVLEKFSLALIAPCSQDFASASQADCSCFRTEIVAHVKTTLALTTSETKKPSLDNKRAHLVADIMENEDMKEILSKENTSIQMDDDQVDDGITIDNYSIDTVNLNRLRNLQADYDDLMTCYENLKHEKEYLQIRCCKYEELEKELESLRSQLREYNLLWTEKEHYRKRSQDLDLLKEQFMVLTDETTNLETQLKAELEINKIKTTTIEELRSNNISLEKKINDIAIGFEKEKNSLHCKLKEYECKIMCQEQQIKSLSAQIDLLLEQENDKKMLSEDSHNHLTMIDEIASLKEQIKNLKEALLFTEEEKQNDFQENLQQINKLKLEIEDWKRTYEKIVQQNEYYKMEVHELREENKTLSLDVEKKTFAVNNLMDVINKKSEEVNRLMDETEEKTAENRSLINRLSQISNDKEQAITSLELARRESKELLEKVKEYNVLVQNQDETVNENNQLRNKLYNTIEENKKLKSDLDSKQNNQCILLEEIEKLRNFNNKAVDNIDTLCQENVECKRSLELIKKESEILEEKVGQFEELSKKFLELQRSHHILIKEKNRLENELKDKIYELNIAIHSIELTKKESKDLLIKTEHIKDDLIKLNSANESEKQTLQRDLMNKTEEINNLLQNLNNYKEDNERLQKNLLDLKKQYDEILDDKNLLQCDFDKKSEELNNLYNTLEKKIEENRGLHAQLKYLQKDQNTTISNLQALEHENSNTKIVLQNIRKESDILIEKLKNYEILELEFNKLNHAHDQMKLEKDRLQKELDSQLADLRRMEQKNSQLNAHSQNLLEHSENLEKSLITARNEVIASSPSPQVLYSEIEKELENMKQEKVLNHKKIRDLLDKLEESENIISNFSENILARDHKISIMENHINNLEDEVRRLQDSLSEVIETGEQLSENNYQKIGQSLQSMEAHHSRATHNMKMELAKLQNENNKLEKQLSHSKMRIDESQGDKHKYLSQISHLQNEREIIVTDIKQLELKNVGDSALSPDNCGLDDILTSLARIRKYLEAKSSKSTSLEQTLLKVKTSSQLLLNKADEAKRIAEKEKQKFISEKEDAVRDRLNMEKQLLELKENFGRQISHDKDVIKDLEAEILNQKLIIDKINKTTQDYILKLNDELKSLQMMYQSSTSKVEDLQQKLKNISEENTLKQEMLEKVNFELNEKSKEVAVLQKDLESIKNYRTGQNIEIQADLSIYNKDMGSQTMNNEQCGSNDEKIDANFHRKSSHEDVEISINKFKIPKSSQNNKEDKVFELLPTHKPHSVNEVQILTANIEPTFDFIRSSYLNYKLKRLSLAKLEQHSFSKDINSNTEKSPLSINNIYIASPGSDSNQTGKTYQEDKSDNVHLIDIYNRRSMHTNSSKLIHNVNEYDLKPHSPTKSSAFTGFGLTIDCFDTDSNAKTNNINSLTPSEKSADKDVFLIYKDSETINKSETINTNQNTNKNSKTVSETFTVQSIAIDEKYKSNNKNKRRIMTGDEQIFEEEIEENEDDSVKPKLNINLPRIETDSPSLVTTSDGDKKSLDSYTIAVSNNYDQIFSNTRLIEPILTGDNDFKPETPSIPTISNNVNQRSGPLDSADILSDEETIKRVIGKQMELEDNINNDKTKHKFDDLRSKNLNNIAKDKDNNESKRKYDHMTKVNKHLDKNGSHHKLSRVDGDVLLIKSLANNVYREQENSPRSHINHNFGLDYILNTVQHEVGRDSIRHFKNVKPLRKSRSDQKIFQSQSYENSDTSPSKQCSIKATSFCQPFVSSMDETNCKEHSKSYVERSIMAKTDPIEKYENKIQDLTKVLENIEKDYKKKLEAIKIQYDSNIKSIINEHNEGVKSIQGLHEETLQDIIKMHENEVENLRSMSIDAMRKADKLEKENRSLKSKIHESSTGFDEEPIKITTHEMKRRKSKARGDTRILTKTHVEEFNVKPKPRSHGPCTCSLDINISDTIRSIFEQVDTEQRKIAENAYLKYIANKIIGGNVDVLDAQELSFLHLKVCRTWKTKLTKEEALQKKIDSLENELLNKQRHAQQHIAELDRKVAEERKRLQEVREAVCRNIPADYQDIEPDTEAVAVQPPTTPNVENDLGFGNFTVCRCNYELGERRSAGDLIPGLSSTKPKKLRADSHRAVLAKMDVEERRDRRLYSDEPPTRLRRTHDRPALHPRPNKK